MDALEIPGFPSIGVSHTDEIKTKNAKAKKSGGFQSMGLLFELLKGITKRGYKIPTPIQRKTIPLILEGRDVVAMAKTGSGKTACFLIPMFEKLKCRDPTKGVRALILSPSRELAIQTYKFIKEIGKFLDIKTILVLGGDSMDSQFSSIHTNPDVIVATPGRFLHLCVEMDLKLNSIEYVVFDESDRLFEMGFGQQLNEILHRLPSSRQMVLFSATLPKLLVDFARAGLSDPVLLRLDVESKLPEALSLKFIYCRPDDRYTSLVVLLKHLIPGDAQTVVFAGTQHHVELISHILDQFSITNTSVYSSLDPSARKINTAKFVNKKVSVLVVTDVAARGIDIPNLDYVVNLHFPGKPKLFLHRVGRCARAGRSGTAFSIFATEDAAHLLDLHLFLNRPVNLTDSQINGTIPQDLLEEEHLSVMDILKDGRISGLVKTSENAFKKYMSSRPVASTESNAQVKQLKFFTIKILEDFIAIQPQLQQSADSKRTRIELIEEERKNQENKHDIMVRMKNFRPPNTIFEINCAKTSKPFTTMKEQRDKFSNIIEKYHNKADSNPTEPNKTASKQKLNKTLNDDNKEQPSTKKRKVEKIIDRENYIPYESSDKHTEAGLAIDSFEKNTMNAEFSVVERQAQQIHKPGMKKWDRIKKKMVSVSDPRSGKIRTESGAWIPASFKTGRYNNWKEKTKIEERIRKEVNVDGEDNDSTPFSHEKQYPVSRRARHNVKMASKKFTGKNDNEMKSADQIVKSRMRLEFIKKRNTENATRKAENRKRSMRKNQRPKGGKKSK